MLVGCFKHYDSERSLAHNVCSHSEGIANYCVTFSIDRHEIAIAYQKSQSRLVLQP